MSPSVDYILTLLLAVVLGVKYIVFDRDEDAESQDDAPVATTTVPASSAAGDRLDACDAVKSNGSAGQSLQIDGSAGQLRQIEDVVEETLHCEIFDHDITPTASSLYGAYVELFSLLC